jgi:hypothetical protein
VKLRPALDWLEDQQKRPTVLIDLDRAVENVADEDAEARLAVIPEAAFLQEAAQLFDDAIHRSAPEPWYHLAIGATLRGMPNAKGIAPDYSCIIVDMLLHDHETRERGCEPDFSPAIFVCALRKMRRTTEFVPSPAEILKACQHYRKNFKELANDVETLIAVRENAEQVVNAVQLALADPDLFGEWTEEDELECQKRLQQRKAEGYVYVDIPDEDLPF